MYKSVLFCCLVVYVTAAPPTDVVPLEKQQPTVIPIVSQSEELEPNGTYKFSYETGNGIKREETSYSKIVPHAQGRSAGSNEGGESDESDEIHVQRGSYSYTAPDGTVISVRYIADENGFQPIGDHIPQAISIAASSNSAEKSGRALDIKDSADAGSVPVVSRVRPSPEQSETEKRPESEEVKVANPKNESVDAASGDKGQNSETASTPAAVQSEITTKAKSQEPNAEASTTEATSPEAIEVSTAGSESSSTVASESSTVSESSTTEAATSAATATEAGFTPEAVSATEEATSPVA